MALLTFAQQKTLVKQGLAREKISGDFSTFKYDRKVMFEDLWYKFPDTQECRGHVYNNKTEELIQAAPAKSFAYLENGAWKDKPMDTPVHVYKKINGFMAASTMYKGKPFVSTTGTTDSAFQKLAYSELKAADMFDLLHEDYTTLFEIVAASDPHIVEEELGCHFLGLRRKATGVWIPSLTQKIEKTTLREALIFAEIDRGEGFMLYTEDFSEVVKLKTTYYVGKKYLMRCGKGNAASLFSGKLPERFPLRWVPLLEQIKVMYTAEQWVEIPAETRRIIIERLESFNPI